MSRNASSRHLASRYARWAALAALAVALAVAGVYLRRVREARQVLQEIPEEVPAAVQQQTAGFSFSKVEGDRTLFTVRAAKATEYAQNGRNVLEDVWVTFYGKKGERADDLRTHSCDYTTATGEIQCAGEVQIDLRSGNARREPADKASAARIADSTMHVKTSGVTFYQKTGQAVTDHLVTFRFPQGDGKGVGFRYDSQQGQLELRKDVRLLFHAAASGADPATSLGGVGVQDGAVDKGAGDLDLTGGPSDLKVASSSMVYLSKERRVTLAGPVVAEQRVHRLSAGKLDVELDEQLRARRLIASDKPVLRDQLPTGSRTVAAERISASLSEQGWLEQTVAEGTVHAVSVGSAREDHLDADRTSIQFTGAESQPQKLMANGHVRVRSSVTSAAAGGATRTLETSELAMDFAAAAPGEQPEIERITTPAAVLNFQSSTMVSGQKQADAMQMTSQHLQVAMAKGNEIRQVDGSGGVEIRRQIGSQPVQVSRSREMSASFSSGEWTTLDQKGDVRFTQGDQSGSADLTQFDHARGTVKLTGSVAMADSRQRTTASSGTFYEMEHRLEAQGGVVTTDLTSGGGASMPAAGPGAGVVARISSDRMTADTETGHAIYFGGARLWRGDSVIEASMIELDRATEKATASGTVRAVLPQNQTDQANGAGSGKVGKGPSYWHTWSDRMTYESAAGKARLEGNVKANSDQGTIQAEVMDLFFGDPAATASQAPSTGRNGQTNGGTQLVRAVADGHVVVEQEDREANANHADYVLATAKVILTGGPPTVRDASGNVTTGRQLTFDFHDDTIKIDSTERMRTLTLHRVEK